MSKDNSELTELTIDIERLLFRRQFLLGPRPFTPNQYWSYIQLQHKLYLSAHTDLPFFSVTEQGLTITLIGHAIDPYHPQANESDILNSLVKKVTNFSKVIESTSPLVGRWVMIFQNQKDTHVFTDPCGFRQVYYHWNEKELWCASQPELIKMNCHLRLNSNPMLMSFLTHPGYVQQESPWIGSSTLYENCFHLLPNHYLSINSADQIRFYSGNEISSKTTSEIVKSASVILQGALLGLTNRYSIRLALSAGVDSRILLAASRYVRNDIEYFVYRQRNLGTDYPDIWVPKKIANKLGIKFVVKTPRNDLPGWFISILSHNVTCARVLPKTLNIYDKLISCDTKININGNGGEICRNYFDKYGEMDINNLSITELASLLLSQKPIPSFFTKEIEKWRNKLEISLSTEGLNILDLLYWEQRLGNWGAQYPAEQDIAVEEISPFNCRKLIQILSASPRHLRTAPDYPLYRALMKEMWPGVLKFPINPQSKINTISIIIKKIRPHIPPTVVRILKKIF